MGAFGPMHWIIVAVVALLLFGGAGRLSGMMGDAAKGIRAFRDGLKGEDDTTPPTTAATPPATPAEPTPLPPARENEPAR